MELPANFFDGATLVVVGTGIWVALKYTWEQARDYFSANRETLEERERAFEGKRDERIEQLEAEQARFTEKLDRLTQTITHQRRAIDWMAMEIARLDPGSKLLTRVNTILGLDLPVEMEALARKLDD